MTRAVIFDLDGVILDTEKLYMRFWLEAAHFYGYSMKPEHVLGIRSLATKFAAEKLKHEVSPDFDIELVKNKRIELMAEFVEKHGVETKPGAYEVLSFLHESNIPCALATATPFERASSMLKSVNLFHFFDEIACAYMVKNGKPEPDVYIYAAEKLGMKPCECIAVEDSPNGILSAYRAGCKTIMVPDSTQPDQEISKMLYQKCDSLLDLKEFLKCELIIT